MNPLNRFVVCCDCNRPTLDTIRSAGFEVTELEQTELPNAPPFARPLVVGTAVVVPWRRRSVRVSVCCGGPARSEVGGHRLGVGQLGRRGSSEPKAVFQNGPSRWVHGPT